MHLCHGFLFFISNVLATWVEDHNIVSLDDVWHFGMLSKDKNSRKCLLVVWRHVLVPCLVSCLLSSVHESKQPVRHLKCDISQFALAFWVLWLVWICVVTGCFAWAQHVLFILQRDLEFCGNVLTLTAIRNCYHSSENLFHLFNRVCSSTFCVLLPHTASFEQQVHLTGEWRA